MAWGSRRVGALLAALLASSVVRAEDKTQLEAEFLEFLGSLDSDDEVWTEFLDAADLTQVSSPSDTAKAKPEPEPEKVKDDEP